MWTYIYTCEYILWRAVRDKYCSNGSVAIENLNSEFCTAITQTCPETIKSILLIGLIQWNFVIYLFIFYLFYIFIHYKNKKKAINISFKYMSICVTIEKLEFDFGFAVSNSLFLISHPVRTYKKTVFFFYFKLTAIKWIHSHHNIVFF